MHPLLPSLAAAVLYFGAAGYQGLHLARRSQPSNAVLLLVGVVALLFHGGSLFMQMHNSAGLNLDFFNTSSLIAFTVIALIPVSYTHLTLPTKRIV